MRLRVLIADDEPLARKRLRRLLSAEPEVQIAGECATGDEVIEAAARLRPEVLLLDVEMPGLDGLKALESLGPERPLVIFVTAHAEHAVRAFAVNAIDYLLKPYSPGRLREALGKVRTQSALRTLAKPAWADRIAVRSNGRIGIVRVKDIDYLEADRNYVRIVCGKSQQTLRDTLTAVEARLDPRQFVRIHRSTIVNIDKIQELTPWAGGDYAIVLRDGRVLTLSRTYKDRLPALFGR